MPAYNQLTDQVFTKVLDRLSGSVSDDLLSRLKSLRSEHKLHQVKAIVKAVRESEPQNPRRVD